jgi:non-heme chloroperoxidase
MFRMSPTYLQTATATKRIALENGIELEYAEQGDPDGVPVVMLHGYTDSWHSFEPLLPYLPESIHAFAVTQRGHGDATRPVSGYTPSAFAGDVALFIEALGLGSVVIAGHSMGSTNAQKFAIDFPESTRGAILMGSFVDIAANPSVDELAREIEALTDDMIPAFAQWFQESTLAQPISPAFLELVVSESTKLTAAQWKAVFSDLIAESITAVNLSAIAAPVLVMWGDQDLFTGAVDQALIIDAISGAKLVTYEGGGHALHWEEPARTAADIVAFVASLSA